MSNASSNKLKCRSNILFYLVIIGMGLGFPQFILGYIYKVEIPQIVSQITLIYVLITASFMIYFLWRIDK